MLAFWLTFDERFERIKQRVFEGGHEEMGGGCNSLKNPDQEE